MKLILSSCDFGNPLSARFISDNLCKPISDCKVLYFPNEKFTPEKIKSGKYEERVAAFGLTDFSGLALYKGILVCHYTEDRKADFDTLNSLGKYRVIALSDDQSMVVKA